VNSDGEATRVLLAAGGTGGHLFPAQALAEALAARGVETILATDHRVGHHGQDFPAISVHEISSATLTGRSPVAMAKTGLALTRGVREAMKLIDETGPSAVVGFGGYPSFPPIMAGVLKRLPTALHEQNAVLGRANRMLAKRVDMLATSFASVKYAEEIASNRVRFTGNPVRTRVIEASGQPYMPPQWQGPFHLLVFGGSQGARYFSDVMPPAVAQMDTNARARLRIVQQCRPEDLDRVRAAYAELGVQAECAPFFEDLPGRMAHAQLIIARSGATTIAELTVIGRPAVLVPLPHAIDNDQLLNAEELQRAGGALCRRQDDLSPETLTSLINELMDQPDMLADAAAAAKSQGRPDAPDRLAELLLSLVQTQ